MSDAGDCLEESCSGQLERKKCREGERCDLRDGSGDFGHVGEQGRELKEGGDSLDDAEMGLGGETDELELEHLVHLHRLEDAEDVGDDVISRVAETPQVTHRLVRLRR